jgi:hypothetical protein
MAERRMSLVRWDEGSGLRFAPAPFRLAQFCLKMRGLPLFCLAHIDLELPDKPVAFDCFARTYRAIRSLRPESGFFCARRPKPRDFCDQNCGDDR